MKISKASPIRFYKQGATDFENGSLKAHTGTTYYQEFKGVAKTVVFHPEIVTEGFKEWIRESEFCDQIGYTITMINIAQGDEIRLEVKGNIIVKLILDGNVIDTEVVSNESSYENVVFDNLDAGIYEIELEIDDPIAVGIVANSITLTPGTLTIDIQGDDILVHGLTDATRNDLESGALEVPFLALEKR
jgi:multisubunit Na+/H+ antiporter MnhE subunit